MDNTTTPKKKRDHGSTGKLGEDIAAAYLTGQGFRVIERNYRRKWGELDIVAEKSHTLHFVEVKAVSRERQRDEQQSGGGFSRRTEYRPEENVHPKKLERLHRAIQTYLADHQQEEAEWQLDVLAIEIDPAAKIARCRFLENVI